MYVACEFFHAGRSCRRRFYPDGTPLAGLLLAVFANLDTKPHNVVAVDKLAYDTCGTSGEMDPGTTISPDITLSVRSETLCEMHVRPACS